jgi:hypothetical protein
VTRVTPLAQWRIHWRRSSLETVIAGAGSEASYRAPRGSVKRGETLDASHDWLELKDVLSPGLPTLPSPPCSASAPAGRELQGEGMFFQEEGAALPPPSS